MVVLGHYDAVLVGIWWYWVSITWYCLVLSGTRSYKAFMPVYIEKSGDLDRRTNKQGKIELLSQSTKDG